jgi:hypothetical protein
MERRQGPDYQENAIATRSTRSLPSATPVVTTAANCKAVTILFLLSETYDV